MIPQINSSSSNYNLASQCYSAKEFQNLLIQGFIFPPCTKVKGCVDLRYCNNQKVNTLPEGLEVDGDLVLYKCTELEILPENLKVSGDLKFSECKITSLPKNLQVGGFLVLTNCNKITSLSEDLHVPGDLVIQYCKKLTSLPDGLQVDGALRLSSCKKLTSLANRLQIKGNLSIENCQRLTILPEDLKVGGSLILSDTSLTSLPNWITTLGPTSTGYTRSIELRNSGLSDDIIERLRNVNAPGIQFHFSQWAAAVTKELASIEDAVTFWESLVPSFSVTITGKYIKHKIQVCRFFSRLINTPEYTNENTRKSLATRVFEMLFCMDKEQSLCERIELLICGAQDTCDDRIIFGMDDIEIEIKIYECEQLEVSKVAEQKLLELAKGLFFLEKVRAYAREYSKNLQWVDEVEVYLAFQIGLSKPLGLPLTTTNMIFARYSQVSQSHIEQAEKEIQQDYSEIGFQEFLNQWEPWQKYQRRLAVVPYENLPISETKLPDDGICIIMQEKPENPVLYDGHWYEYSAFVENYIKQGKDPYTRDSIDWKDVQKAAIIGGSGFV